MAIINTKRPFLRPPTQKVPVAKPPPPPRPPPAPAARPPAPNTASSFTPGPGRAPVNLSGGAPPLALPAGEPSRNAALAGGITGANALRTLNYERALPGAVAHFSGQTYAPEGNGSLAADAIARRAVTGKTDYGTDNSLNCTEACVDAQDYFAHQRPPVETELVVKGDHAVLRMPDGQYFDPTRVMNGNAGADPFLSSQEAAEYQGVEGITLADRRELETSALAAAAKLGPGATAEQREQAAVGGARLQALKSGETGAVDAANEGAVDVNALARQDAAVVSDVYAKEGPEAAARKMQELSEANKAVPGYTDALIRESKPTLDAMGVDLAARVTNKNDDDGEDGHLTQDTLTALSAVADNASPAGQAELGGSLARALPDTGELNQYDDAFTELKEDGKGANLGGAIVNSLKAQGKTGAAGGLEENVQDGTWKTQTPGVGVTDSSTTPVGEQVQNGQGQPKMGPDGKPLRETNVGVGVTNSAETSASAGQVEGSTEVGDVTLQGQVQGPSITMGATSSAKVTQDGIEVHADVRIDATAVQAGGSGTVTVPVELPGGERIDVTVKLSAEGKIGANGVLSLDIKIGKDGKIEAGVSGSGFAGAQGTLSGEVTLEHEGEQVATGKVELKGAAGVGASFDAGATAEGDKIGFHAKGAAVGGFGGGIAFSGSVDLSAAVNMVTEVGAGLVRAGFKEGSEFVADSGAVIWNGAAQVGGALWDGTQWVGDATWNGTKWVGGKAADAANAAWDAAGDAAGWLGDHVPNPF